MTWGRWTAPSDRDYYGEQRRNEHPPCAMVGCTRRVQFDFEAFCPQHLPTVRPPIPVEKTPWP